MNNGNETSLTAEAGTKTEAEPAASNNIAGNKKKKLFIAIGVAVAIIILVAGCFWYTQIKLPYDQAVDSYNTAVKNYQTAASALNDKNEELDGSISSLQAVIDSDEPPFDKQLLTDAGATIGAAQGAKNDIPKAPEMPSKTEEINATAIEIDALTSEIQGYGDYGKEIDAINAAQTKLENSIRQMSQVTNPSEQFVIKRLTGLPNITGIQAVTEDNDPNGKLNKQGGYTATVYFSSDLVDQNSVTGKDIVDKGTNGGGAVEVYKTSEEAEARNTYLGAFDGGILSSGSHVVCGTVLIRTSDELTASQQKEMEKNIREALLRLE